MKKSLNILFIIVIIFLSTGIYFFNKKIDPYGIKYMENMGGISQYDRDFIYTYINLSKDYKYDYLYICSSSGIASMSPFIFKDYTGKQMFVINLSGGSPLEDYDLLKYFLKVHPETKNVIVSLEYNKYIKCFNEYTLPRKPSNNLYDFMRVYFSIKTINDSISKVYNTLTENKKDDRETFTYNNMRRYMYSGFCVSDNLNILKKINTLMNENNINAIYYITPANVLYLADMYNNGLYNVLEEYKNGISEITPYYDFSIINDYTKQPIRLYYEDILHPNAGIFSTKVIDCLINKKCEKNFAQYITQNNADKKLREQKKDIERYISENRKYIDDFLTDKNNIDRQKAEKSYYIDELPKHEYDLFYRYK